MTTKVCRRCGKNKLTSQFAKHARSKDGLQQWCKQCVNERKKEIRRARKVAEVADEVE